MEYIDIIARLKSLADPKNVKGMERYGINPKNTLGVSIPVLRNIARETGKDHKLAGLLWESGIHEARLLAGFVDDPALVDERQMDRWARDFDSWDICDQCCSNLFDRTAFAYEKAFEWSKCRREFVKRAGFVMMAALSVHDKKARDTRFEKFLPVIRRESADERNFVKKAVNWALRQIGKRNSKLNAKAIRAAGEISRINSKAARWVASDALRELKAKAIRFDAKKK